MFKKIGLYSLLFVMVTLSTAAVIVFLNRQPNVNLVKKPTTQEDMTITNIMNATMSLDNYRATLEAQSSDKDIDLSGYISVLDLTGVPSADIYISGKFLDQPITIRAKYKNEWIYASINNFGLKIKSGDVAEIFEIVSTLLTKDSSGDGFSLDSILSSLENMKVDKKQDSYNVSLKMPNIGDISLVADKDYIPSIIKSENITVLGKNINFSLNGKRGAAGSVSLTSSEQKDYIDLSSSKEMIIGIANTLGGSPMVVEGSVNVFGQNADLSFIMDKNANIYGTLSLNNINVEIYYYNKELFIDACGTKIRCDLDDVFDILAPYFKLDLNELLKQFNISKNTLCVAGMDFNFDVKNNYISGVQFSHKLVSGSLTVSNTLPVMVNAPTGYESALTSSEVVNVLNKYAYLLEENEFSFAINGNFGAAKLNLNGYLTRSDDKLGRIYIGDRINSLPIHFWNVNNMSYLLADGLKVKFNNTFSSNMLNYVSDKFGLEMPDLNQIVEILSKMVQSLDVQKDGKICATLEGGLVVELEEKADCVFLKIDGNYLNEEVNISISLYNNSSLNKTLYYSLMPSGYTDMSSYDNLAQSAINTLTNSHNVFVGNVSIKALDIIKINIGIKLETWFVNNKFEFKLTLDNLPTTEIFTDAALCKYKSQKSVLTYKDGKLHLVRTAKTISNKEVVRLDRNYTLKDISMNMLIDILGLGGWMEDTIKDMFNGIGQGGGTTFSPNTLFALEKVDSGFAAALKTSLLAKELSDTNLTLITKNNQIDTISCNLKASVWAIIGISINVNLKLEV